MWGEKKVVFDSYAMHHTSAIYARDLGPKKDANKLIKHTHCDLPNLELIAKL